MKQISNYCSTYNKLRDALWTAYGTRLEFTGVLLILVASATAFLLRTNMRVRTGEG